MKTKILSLTALMALIIMVSGCNWVDSNINVDPTAPAEAPYSTILPTTQVGMAYIFGGDYYRFTSLFTQHHLGTARQHESLYNYELVESDLPNAWNNMYSGPLMDLDFLIKDGKKKGCNYYVGIAMIMTAVGLGNTSDLLGDIPYSESFQGNDNLKPVFDSQEKIYTTIQSLLDEAIGYLGGKDGGVFIPGKDDFIYNGDLTKWTKAAWSLKARYALHVKDYANALAYSLKGFTSNSDDMLVAFGAKETQANPFYQFMQQRGDISMGNKLMELMKKFKDPRIMPFTSQDTSYLTSLLPNGFYTKQNAPVPFITYAEIKFIQAECYLDAQNGTQAYKAYQDATKASCMFFGITDAKATEYVESASVAVGADKLTLEDVINQKYIALYAQMETWTDWRRTSLPKLTPSKGTKIVRRMVYPQPERLYNGANLKKADGYTESIPVFIFSKMWWDRKW